jgi:CheY-like chemotaxis protein
MSHASILLVDDDPFVRAVVDRRLTAVGYAVTSVEDGAAALAALEAGDYDVIILDGMMPVADGFHVLRQMRARRVAADTPVIMLTAMKRPEDEQQARRLGVSAFVQKPFDPLQLIASIDDLVASRAANGLRSAG